MNLNPVYFKVLVGDRKFVKIIFLIFLPQVNDLLKIANHSFVITEVEHNLDAYVSEDFKQGSFCVAIKAKLNKESDFYAISNDLFSAGWSESVLLPKK